ncbi:MAG: GNAT family N-acetyltransferase [Clostridiales bacterium]|nr:GNAT family N-acetyltransferase [Clostridiales bacterium]
MTDRNKKIVRLARGEDVPQLRALWKTVFGDGDEEIGHFFSTWFSTDLTVVIDIGGNPVSAAYILPVGELVLPCLHIDGRPGRQCTEQDSAARCYPVAMLYAIATLPEWRGRGYGEAVTRMACAQAAKKGYPAVVLKPADEGLFAFYEKRTDFRSFFEACEAEYSTADLPARDGHLTMAPVSAAEYRRIRQSLLRSCAYIDMEERALTYQQYLCKKAGGGLYKLLRNGGNGGCTGCAVIEPGENGAVHMKELLLSPGSRVPDAVSAAVRLVKADRYYVRTLPSEGGKQNRRFAMLAPVESCPNVSYVYSAKWYGPAFD